MTMDVPIPIPANPATDEQIAAWFWQNEVVPRLSSFGERFQDPIRLIPPQAAALKKVKARLKGVGAIVALVGVRGIGKTTLTAAIAQERAAKEGFPPNYRTVLYRQMVSLISKYKPLYSDMGSINIEALTESRDAVCRKNLLVVDELHECDDQRLKNKILTDIIDRRYADRLDTILISNQTPADFRATTSDSILSRLSEHGTILECKWPSFRVQEAAR